jgi:DNA-binding phage protein
VPYEVIDEAAALGKFHSPTKPYGVGRIEEDGSATIIASMSTRGAAVLSCVLRGELDAKGWTATHLARESGVPQSRVSELLSGTTADPRLSTVLALLAALGRDLGWLHRQGVRPEA